VTANRGEPGLARPSAKTDDRKANAVDQIGHELLGIYMGVGRIDQNAAAPVDILGRLGGASA